MYNYDPLRFSEKPPRLKVSYTEENLEFVGGNERLAPIIHRGQHPDSEKVRSFLGNHLAHKEAAGGELDDNALNLKDDPFTLNTSTSPKQVYDYLTDVRHFFRVQGDEEAISMVDALMNKAVEMPIEGWAG